MIIKTLGSLRVPLTAFALLAAGCTEDNPTYDPDPYLPGTCRSGEAVQEVFSSFEHPGVLDVVVVIDDSGDVADLQAAFAPAFAQFVARLGEADVDFQVAQISAGVVGPLEYLGAGTGAEGCQDNRSGVVSSAQDGWQQSLQCNLQPGGGRQAFQQSLHTIQALAEEPVSDGFFRPRARRLVVVLTNEDDCSWIDTPVLGDEPARRQCASGVDDLISVDDVLAQLTVVGQSQEAFQVAIFSGPPSFSPDQELRPNCSASHGSAYAANRLYDFAQQLGPRAAFANICVDDFLPAFDSVDKLVGSSSTVTLCPSSVLVHEPLSVDIRDDEGYKFAVPPGEGGFVYLGPTSSCSQGAFSFDVAAVENADRIEIEYCAETSP